MTDLVIRKGETFSRVLRWESLPFIYTPITAISKAAPVVITAAGHGLADGWRAAVVSAGGMRQINAKKMPPRLSELHRVTFVSSSQLVFNDVDSTEFSTYTSGGALVSYTPASLSGYSARMQVRATAEAADPALVSLVSPTEIALDDTAHTITITIDAVTTAAYTWYAGEYDLELVSLGGTVTKVMSGSITAIDEVTR